METPRLRHLKLLTMGQWFTAIVIGAGLLWRLAVWYLQPGAYLDDEVGHFIIARDAWNHPELVFSWWGRIGCTLFYMPGSLFGWEGARATSLLASQIIVFLTYGIARQLNLKQPILAVLLLELQPWFATSSHELLTVLPALFCMVLAVWLELKEKSVLAALTVGYLPLIRHEFLALLILWGLYCLFRSRFLTIFALATPIALYNFAAKIYLGVWPFRHFLTPKGTTLYGSGQLDHYIRLISENDFVGFPILALAAAGLYWMLQTKCRFLILLWAGSYLVVHTLIYWMGAFSSGGFAIFILPLAPFIAISASAGLIHIASCGKTPHNSIANSKFPQQIAGILVSGVLLLSSFAVGYGALKPRLYNGDAVSMRQAANYLHEHDLTKRTVASTNVWLYYWLPLTTPHKHGRWEKTLWIANRMNELPPGAIMIWDKHYSDRFGHKLDTLKSSNTWHLLHIESYKEIPLWAIFEKI